MDPRQLLSRLSQLKAEGDAIMQQLIASGMPPEQIMAAVEGGGQATPQIPPGVDMGMGGRPGPDLPMPSGVNMAQEYEAARGGGPRGLLAA
jgi:hypothetical protein